MPSIDKLKNMTAESLDERQAEIDTLLSLYIEQITKDYHACRLDKERLILLSHLSQQQSFEVLEAHLSLARVMESSQIHVKQSVERELVLRTADMEKHICEMLDQNRKAIRFSLMESQSDVEDMKRVLESQKEMMRNSTLQNTQLVTENSELRMHLSFMPVEYQDYVKTMQTSNHQEYRNQRRAPKVIVPTTDHKDAMVDIELEDAPMSHPSVQHLFRDARYSTIGEARQYVEKGFALRQRQIHKIYKLEAPWRVDLPPPPSPAPAPPPAASQRDSRVDYQRLMAAAHKTPQNYVPSPPNAATAVPTTQHAPPPAQQAIRPARVSLDYRRADQPPLALIEDFPMQESSSEPPMPNPNLPPDHWRNVVTGKGKRPPPQYAGRHPHKYSRSDDRNNPPSRTPQTKEPVIPLPPNAQIPVLNQKFPLFPR
jgi:hypothetical protein